MQKLPHIEVLRARFAPARFDRYVDATAGDSSGALRLYEWNAQTSAVLYVAVGQFEVLLRNALDTQLVKFHRTVLGGNGEWWRADANMPLRPKQQEQVRVARSRVAQSGSPVTHGKVVAELMFGFWRFLTDAPHSSTLWAPALRHAFPHLRPKVRTEVYDRLTKLNSLRNRLAHYEPIHHLPLDEHHRDLLVVAGWICPTTAAWIWSTTTDRLHTALQTKP
jgi:hypothetical protein